MKSGTVSPKNIAQVKTEIRAIFITKTLAEWVALFGQTDACAEPVMSLSKVFSDKLALERGMVVNVPLPTGGTVKQIANPIKFSRTPQEYKTTSVPTALGYTK